MFDLKLIRRDIETWQAAFQRRPGFQGLDELLALDQQHRSCLAQLQEVQSQRNHLADAIGAAKAKKEACDDLLQKSEALKEQEGLLAAEERRIFDQLHFILERLPNRLHPDVPDGENETGNQVVFTWGQPREWREGMMDHSTLGAAFDGMDFSQAALVSGARFVYLRKEVAQLERALGQWMLDTQVFHFGFTEMAVPYLVRSQALFGTGQLPKFKEDLFSTCQQSYLIPTGEVPLVNWVAEKKLDQKELPYCLTALTPCFRSEAGSSGKDTHGMIRHHQFHKVELVVICTPDQEETWHEKITSQAEYILQTLGLAYRKVLLCAGDTGSSAQKTYDLEVWLPSQKSYREIASCSRCGDFQARRMNARYKGDDGKLHFVHTLNGSGLPVGRTLAALLENGQDEEGNVHIPEILQPYMRGKKLLSRQK